MAKTNKKNSAKRKLIPAVSMLTVSAVMLSTATYAWFTMSREVEVRNIQMTATVPEDIQISLGKVYGDSAASAASTSESYELTNSTGWLKLNSSTGMAEAPREGKSGETGFDKNHELDWSNTVDISAYYAFGKLIPASSTDGENIFFTPDAAGVGRTLKAGASFYQAATKKTATAENTISGGGTGKFNATAHIYGADKQDAQTHEWKKSTEANDGGYTKSTEWKNTNDDGYYIDIPVWFRTTSTEETKLYVTGYVTDKTEENKSDTDDLYQAVRVAILDNTGAADKGCLTLKDGGDTIIDPVTGNATHTSTFFTNTTDADNVTKNILDSQNYNGRDTSATAGSIYAVSGTTMTQNSDTRQGEPQHGIITQNNGGAGNDVVTLNAGTGSEYGLSKMVIVRVWLEGEDKNCWNENAGQDWNIALKFSKDPLPSTNPNQGGQGTGN